MAEITSLVVFEQGSLASSSDVNANFEALRVGHNTNNISITNINDSITGINTTLDNKANRDLSNLSDEGKSSLLNSTLYSINKAKVDENGYPDVLNAPGSGTVTQIEYTDLIPSNAGAPFSTSRWTGDVGSVYTSTYTLATPYETAANYPATATLHASCSPPKQAMANMVVYYSDGTSDTIFGTTYYNGTYTREFYPNGRTITKVSVYGGYGISGEGGAWVGGIQINAPKEVTISVSTADTLYFNTTVETPLYARNAQGKNVKKINLYPINITGKADGTYNVYLSLNNNVTYLLNNNVTMARSLPASPSVGDICILDYSPLEVKQYKTVTTESVAELSSNNTELVLHIDKTVFETQINTTGIYNFVYDGSIWTLDNVTVNLANYGISYVGTVAATNVISVDYTQATSTNSWEDFEDIPCGTITIENTYIEKVIQPVFNANPVDKNIVEAYINGTEGYNLYSNGYCEQWGNGSGTISLLKKYKDTDYNVLTVATVSNKNADKFTLSTSANWQTKGYIN